MQLLNKVSLIYLSRKGLPPANKIIQIFEEMHPLNVTQLHKRATTARLLYHLTQQPLNVIICSLKYRTSPSLQSCIVTNRFLSAASVFFSVCRMHSNFQLIAPCVKVKDGRVGLLQVNKRLFSRCHATIETAAFNHVIGSPLQNLIAIRRRGIRSINEDDGGCLPLCVFV